MMEENARFCQKCGTPTATYSVYAPPYAPPPPPARPLRKDPWILFAVVLISVFIVVIVAIAVYSAPFFSMDFNQTNPGNYDLNSFSVNLPAVLHF